MKATHTILVFGMTFAIGACTGRQRPDDASGSPEPPQRQEAAIDLLFTYGSEKKPWIEEATPPFNGARRKTSSGKAIRVELAAMGSGDCIEGLLTETRKAHLTSPASGAFIELGNARSRVKTGSDLVGPTENLVLSPVVIAMWKPMAEALGWGRQPVGWSDILALARDPQGWASRGSPQWGAFKLGHTHPEYSNSGLIAVFAEVYAGAGKVRDLTLADLQRPEVGRFLQDIEHSVVHYGESTGFFGRKMFTEGPGYLSAAVLYESMVIESYDSSKYRLPFPIVAVYPKEGTFWSDHPVGIVNRAWVTEEHREAARIYIDYLLEDAQQRKALERGFRPGNPAVPLGPPIDTGHGVDPAEPKTTLGVPSAEVLDAGLGVWKKHKKKAYVTLLLDVSGSMKDNDKIIHARSGASQLVSMLDDDDMFSLMPFNATPLLAVRKSPLGPNRAGVNERIQGLFAEGGTALYDAIAGAFDLHQKEPERDMISAIVVLSDGADRNSRTTLQSLIDGIRSDQETRDTRVFTIGYGAEANQGVLESIADATKARYYAGTPENIGTVFREIATFF